MGDIYQYSAGDRPVHLPSMEHWANRVDAMGDPGDFGRVEIGAALSRIQFAAASNILSHQGLVPGEGPDIWPLSEGPAVDIASGEQRLPVGILFPERGLSSLVQSMREVGVLPPTDETPSGIQRAVQVERTIRGLSR